MHAPPHDLRIRAFVSFMRAESPSRLIDCLLKNESQGIHYGYQKDYDGKDSEEEVIHILEYGALAHERKSSGNH
jgi:hypothetical protein